MQVIAYLITRERSSHCSLMGFNYVHVPANSTRRPLLVSNPEVSHTSTNQPMPEKAGCSFEAFCHTIAFNAAVNPRHYLQLKLMDISLCQNLLNSEYVGDTIPVSNGNYEAIGVSVLHRNTTPY